MKERIRQYCDFRKYDVTDFMEQVGMDGDRFDARNIRVLALRYPDLNKEWLMTGKGDMINADYKGKPLMTEQGDRFKELLTVMEQRGIISNQKELAAQLGYNTSYFSHLVNNRLLTAESCKKLISLVPDLNIEYLMSGFGTLLVGDKQEADGEVAPQPVKSTTSDVATAKLAIVRQADRLIEEIVRHGDELARQGERLSEAIALLKSALTAESVQNPCTNE